jgi:hypothetical protein
MIVITNKKFMRECKRMFNHVGVYGGYQLCRLIGYAEDVDDAYYILRKEDGKIEYASMVGGFFSIKRMGKKGYKYTDVNISHNCPKAEKFEILHIASGIWFKKPTKKQKDAQIKHLGDTLARIRENNYD